jgi:hypothetical protein
MYALDFKQFACNISWDEVTLINQFQYGLHNETKDLLLTMPNLTTLNQVIAQAVCCDNMLFEHQ